jgi:site-specific recombinase XerD
MGEVIAMQVEELLPEFEVYVTDEKELAPRTAEAYLEDIRSFVRWYEGNNSEELEPGDITRIDLREYQSYLQTVKRLKPSTVNRRLVGLKSFLKWSLKEGHIQRMPGFPRPIRQQRQTPQALNGNEQNRLLREVERRGKVRNLALIRIMLSCGLRVKELVTLQVGDIDIRERSGTITVRSGKGNKYREVPVPSQTRKVLREWLAEREKLCPDSPWLFPNRSGRHITVRCVQQMVKNIGYYARLEELHPHILRHTAATNLLRSGADLVTVARILGHESLNTTAIYTQPTVADMSQAVENAEN